MWVCAGAGLGLVVCGSVPGVVRSWASLRRGEPRGGTGGGTRVFRLLAAGVRCLTGGGARSLAPLVVAGPRAVAPLFGSTCRSRWRGLGGGRLGWLVNLATAVRVRGVNR